jgi:8-oxo-dGTP diphosphatase
MGVEGSYTYAWPRPALTVDAVLVADVVPPQLLLIQRKQDPHAGSWALPGGFVDEGETLDAAAGRELQEETSVDPAKVKLTQIGTFGDPGRDPRGWNVCVAYAALVPSTDLGVRVRGRFFLFYHLHFFFCVCV